ncbi:MAG: DinB family protein [Pirellulales bacterium]
MSYEIHYSTPESRDQLMVALDTVNSQASALWDAIPPERFFEPPADGGWTAAQNVVHLIWSTSPVTTALGLPRWVLRLLFGKAAIPSRSFVEVRAAYRALLAEGGQAGRYGPAARPLPSDPLAARQQLLNKWRDVVPRLIAATRRWDETSLDRYRLPHPLLGKLTMREILYFTLYHLGHHATHVAARQHP